jgi:hypothetical protein
MTALGGSLMQVLVPVVCAVAFLRQPDAFGAAVAAWWAGQNLVDLGPYIADARALQIVLLGGATGAEVEGHDWEAILTAFGWLHHDRRLGMAAHVAGTVVMCASLALAGWIAWVQREGSDRGRTGVGSGSGGGRTRVGPGSDPGPTRSDVRLRDVRMPAADSSLRRSGAADLPTC